MTAYSNEDILSGPLCVMCSMSTDATCFNSLMIAERTIPTASGKEVTWENAKILFFNKSITPYPTHTPHVYKMETKATVLEKIIPQTVIVEVNLSGIFDRGRLALDAGPLLVLSA